jgi:hypothetical protein
VVEEGVRGMSAPDELERLAWVVLETVNRAQAKGSTVRLVVPRDPEVAADELGMDPDGDRIQTVVEYLLERGYLAPADVGLTRGAYTITRAGFNWLKKGPPALSEPPETASGPRDRGEEDVPPATGGAQEGAERPWWRRVFGG